MLIHFFNFKTEKVETHFLYVEDILKDSNSANAEPIFKILIKKSHDYGLQFQKLSSMQMVPTELLSWRVNDRVHVPRLK